MRARRGIGSCLLLLLFLSSCQEAVINPPDQIVVGIETNPNNIDPRYAVDAQSHKISKLVFSGLFRRDYEGRLVPDILASMKMVDPTTYVFRLKEGIRFHDGSPLTAADVKFTIESILDPQNHSPYSKSFELIEEMVVTSPQEIVFHLKRPFAPFLENLTIGILPAHLVRRKDYDFRKHPIGSGPFRLLEYRKDSHLILEAFPDYFDGRPKIKRLVFKIIPDSTVRMLELIHGSVDIVQNDFPPYLLPWLERQQDLRILKRPGRNFRYLAFNLRDPILGKLAVRRAIAHAINRPELIRYKLKGLGTLANSLLPPDSWALTEDLPIYEYDPARARQLLEEAGYPLPEGDGRGDSFRFTLLYKTSQNQLAIDIARAIQRYLREVGIRVKIRVNEFQIFFSDIIQGDFQLYCLTAPGVSDPDYYHYLYHSASWPPHGGNRVRYHNPVMDRLIDQGRLTISPWRRREIYRQVQEIAARDLPYLGLWHEMNVAVINRKIKGYRVTPGASYLSLKEAWKEP